jgi:hypothetical protein
MEGGGSSRHTHVAEAISRSTRPLDGLRSSGGDGSRGTSTTSAGSGTEKGKGGKEKGKEKGKEREIGKEESEESVRREFQRLQCLLPPPSGVNPGPASNLGPSPASQSERMHGKGSLTGSRMASSRSTTHIPHEQEREMEVKESSGSEEEYSDSGEVSSESEDEYSDSGSETAVRSAPSLAGDPVSGRIRNSARMDLDQLRRAGQWGQDYYPSEQTTGAVGPGNRLT